MDNTSKKLATIGSWLIQEALGTGQYSINRKGQLVLTVPSGFKPAEIAQLSRLMKAKTIGEQLLKQGPYSLPKTPRK